MKCFVLLTVLAFASKNRNDAEHVTANLGEHIMKNEESSILVKIEEDEYAKKRTFSNYFGVGYYDRTSKWRVRRWSTMEKKIITNGVYRDEETAAHASDTLARKLMVNGEQGHKLNFPDDNTEVHPVEKIKNSIYIGVYYHEKKKLWYAQRWSKTWKKQTHKRCYKDEETAAHASDTLAGKLMANGEQNHKLNFLDNNTEVHPEEETKKSKYIGVTYREKSKKWHAQRWSKNEKMSVGNGTHKVEETAAHASDILAKKLMANGEKNHKLNFPDDNTKVYKYERNKRKRPFDFEYSQTDENNFEK